GAQAQRDLHPVDDPRAPDAEPLLAAARPLVDQRPGDEQRVGAVLDGLHADGADVGRRAPVAHRAASARTFRISPWTRPLLATMDGAARASGPPAALGTTPPASSTRRPPAARSHAPRLSTPMRVPAPAGDAAWPD